MRYEIVQADVLSYEPPARFDFVLDSGCLHCISDPALPLYRQRLLAWTNPGADFVLAHWGKRHALDWRPMGPRRRTPERLTRLFAPEFELLSTETEDAAVPLPIGPCVRCTSYRFRRRS